MYGLTELLTYIRFAGMQGLVNGSQILGCRHHSVCKNWKVNVGENLDIEYIYCNYACDNEEEEEGEEEEEEEEEGEGGGGEEEEEEESSSSSSSRSRSRSSHRRH